MKLREIRAERASIVSQREHAKSQAAIGASMAKSRAGLYSQRLKARAAAIRAGQQAAKQRTQRLYQSIESAQAALDYTSSAQLDAAKVCTRL